MASGRAGDRLARGFFLMDDRITLAAVTGAHGIKGEVRLKLFGEGVESLKRHKMVAVGDRRLELISVRAAGAAAVAKFAGIDDRDSAEALRGQTLTVDRTELPPLEEGEYYLADLLGLRCEAPDGELLGTVCAVENFGAGDIIEIVRPGGKKAMIPFREGVADLIDGRIVADPLFVA